MAYREILRILSSYLYFLAALLVLPLLIAAYYQFKIEFDTHPQPHSTVAFALTFLISLGLAWLCAKGAGKVTSIIYRQREALFSVVLIWFTTPVIGALPFLFSGTLERFDQAYFEATSGFTTTGATVLEAKRYDSAGKEIPIEKTYPGLQPTTYQFYGTVKPIEDPLTGKKMEGIEAVGRALLFWRSLTQWIGGMGIIVLFVAFLPELGVKGKFLFQTETSGPYKEGFKPRIKETALQLWKIYLGLTLLEIILLLFVNPQMLLFDAVTIAFSTLSTGGFSVHNENIGYYHQAATEWVIILFMILGSLNFALYHSFLMGKFYRILDSQLLCFLIFLGVLGVFVAWQIGAFRSGLFQLISAQTSTGFFTTDYDTWPLVAQTVIFIAMFIGGMSGSTAGGLKIIRLQIIYQVVKRKIESIFRPKTITITRIGEREIDNTTALSVLSFFVITIVLSVFATFFYVWDHIDLETAAGLTACMVNNTGMGFRAGGASSTMAFLSPTSSYLSSFLMILGRLEFYAVLALFFPTFWRER